MESSGIVQEVWESVRTALFWAVYGLLSLALGGAEQARGGPEGPIRGRKLKMLPFPRYSAIFALLDFFVPGNSLNSELVSVETHVFFCLSPF